MLLGAFTLFHVVLSLVGIGSGFVVAYGLIESKRLDRWTAVFLSTTVLTSVTGFLFPVHHFMPSHAVGILSLIVLAVAILARYRYDLAGGWSRTYAITAVVAFYFNVFVLIAQLFMKVPALKALAPTQTEGPFKISQLTVLVIFAMVGIRAAMRFHAESPRTA
jgi:hypothetical protein